MGGVSELGLKSLVEDVSLVWLLPVGLALYRMKPLLNPSGSTGYRLVTGARMSMSAFTCTQ